MLDDADPDVPATPPRAVPGAEVPPRVLPPVHPGGPGRPATPAPLPGVEGVLGPVDPDPLPDHAEHAERRYPSTIGGACYIVGMLVVTAGLAVAALGSWRLGVQIIAVCLVAMAGLRLVLPQRDAGMLAVRHRAVDAVLLAGSAGVLFFLAATIPNQPG